MRLSKNSAFRFCLFSLTAILPASCFSADSLQSPVVIKQFAADHGSSYAIAARASDLAVDKITQHVILVDTSASQTGIVREASLELVSKTLSMLPPRSTAQIIAVDVACDTLTPGFVATSSAKINSAINALKLRTPLGTTNLKAALHTINKLNKNNRPTSVLYIGDGMAASEFVESGELRSIIEELTASNVSIHSSVLGPQTNADLPGILANLTGGVVHKHDVTPSIIAAAMQLAPVSATSVSVDGKTLSTIGSGRYFLRPDRHTIILGRGVIGKLRQLTIHTEKEGAIAFSAVQCRTVNCGAQLAHAVEAAEESAGINVPLTSLSLLNASEKEFAAAMQKFALAEELLARQGEHRKAKEVKTILTAMQQPGSRDGDQPVQFQDAFNGQPIAADNPLAQVEAEVKLQTQILSAETNAAIDEAGRVSFDQPEYAINLLKDILETIQSSADISPDIREELERRVISALASVRNKMEFNALRSKQIARDQAVAENQRKVIADQRLDEGRIGILIQQVAGLLAEARKGDRNGFEDAEEVSRRALDLQPGNGPATQALVMSEALGQLDKAYRLVNLRHDRFLETLYQVELSHVPFPDEPPIQYPPADVWRALTLVRKPRYESFDLRTERPVEKWLRQMLDKPVPLLDYPGEIPLSEVLDQLQAFFTTTYGAEGGASGTDFRMTIYPDLAELNQEGINSLEDVTVQNIEFEGLTLRNALKLIFDQTVDPQLTYIIQNEVMMITTQAKAESDAILVTRVYPVADLVIPNVQLQGGGGGGFGGGGGNGGGLGGGGGGGGGFGGGGGGGAFSVPPEVIDLLNEAEQGISNDDLSLKKKPAFN